MYSHSKYNKIYDSTYVHDNGLFGISYADVSQYNIITWAVNISWNTTRWISFAGASSYNSVDNTSSHHNGYGIYFDGWWQNTVNHAKIYANTEWFGIYITDNTQSSDNRIYNTQIYDHINGWIHIAGGNTMHTRIDNADIYDNHYGIESYAYNTSISNSRIFGNSGYAILISNNGAGPSYIQSTQIYDNTWAWIYFEWGNKYHTLNNLQIFNNGDGGIKTSDDSYSRDNITLNNSQVYNNSGHWLLLYRTTDFVVNNSHVYNNSANGVYFAGSNNNSGVLNDVSVYNNGSVWVKYDAWSYAYYSQNKLFDNNSFDIYPSLPNANFTAWLSSTYSSLWWWAWLYDDSDCMSCSWVTNPKRPDNLNDLIDKNTYNFCEQRWKNTSRVWTTGLSYRYGINLTGQQLPVLAGAGSSLYTYSTYTAWWNTYASYTWVDYVAQAELWSKLSPDYSNTQCTCNWYNYLWKDGYPLNNDIFINDYFWWNVPVAQPYCYIINALYGDGQTDTTAYTETWGGEWNWQCHVDNMAVVYVTGGTDKLPLNLIENTIYVLKEGNYAETHTIYPNNCNAIVWQTGDVKINSYSYSLSNGSINWVSREYNILNHLIINGGGTNNDQYGVRYSNSINSTLFGLDIYNNVYGIGLYEVHSFDIENINVYNNTYRGVQVWSSSRYININNSQIYNNSGLWLVWSASDFLTVNNTQVYNNQDGIHMSTVKHAVINNSQTYNNSRYGLLLFGASTDAVLNNVDSYNNNVYDIDVRAAAVNAKYYGLLRFNEIRNENTNLVSSELTNQTPPY